MKRRRMRADKWEKWVEVKRKVDGVVYPLIGYAKNMIKGVGREEVLRKRAGLVEFLTEMNDCEKNLLRLMGELSAENA